MAKEYFTIDEVNQLIPQLEYHFQKMLESKRGMAQASNQLRSRGAIPQLLGKVPLNSHPDIHQLQAEARRCYRDFKRHLFALEHMGGEIKDLELGRVDFPARSDGEPAILTWQLGVTDTAYLCPLENTAKLEESSRQKFPAQTAIEYSNY